MKLPNQRVILNKGDMILKSIILTLILISISSCSKSVQGEYFFEGNKEDILYIERDSFKRYINEEFINKGIWAFDHKKSSIFLYHWVNKGELDYLLNYNDTIVSNFKCRYNIYNNCIGLTTDVLNLEGYKKLKSSTSPSHPQ